MCELLAARPPHTSRPVPLLPAGEIARDRPQQQQQQLQQPIDRQPGFKAAVELAYLALLREAAGDALPTRHRDVLHGIAAAVGLPSPRNPGVPTRNCAAGASDRSEEKLHHCPDIAAGVAHCMAHAAMLLKVCAWGSRS